MKPRACPDAPRWQLFTGIPATGPVILNTKNHLKEENRIGNLVSKQNQTFKDFGMTTNLMILEDYLEWQSLGTKEEE